MTTDDAVEATSAHAEDIAEPEPAFVIEIAPPEGTLAPYTGVYSTMNLMMNDRAWFIPPTTVVNRNTNLYIIAHKETCPANSYPQKE